MLQAMPHQSRGLEAADRAEADGHTLLCVTSPTGGGKTYMMARRAINHAARGKRTLILTNRRLLLGQTASTLGGEGASFGYLAAKMDRSPSQPIQIGSAQTIWERCFKSNRWDLPPFDYLEVDECHGQKGPVAQQLIGHYVRHGCLCCGWTATPVGINHIYKHLVVAGTKAELRRAGLLVPCKVFAPDEPDLRGVQRVDSGEFNQAQATKRVMETIVFGDVFKHWNRLNPDGRPTILWAPGVDESRWFVEEFEKMGVSAAHIDGTTPDDARGDIFKASQCGDCQVVCSFGVLREGADMPWVHHGILVQACGALSTYLQIVGRLLRADFAHPGEKTECVLQDHSGAWWRHGSPNMDRNWQLKDTDKTIAAERKKSFEAGAEREPTRCPKCGGIRSFVDFRAPCPHCGHTYFRSVRMIRMTDGTLHKQVGTVHKRKDYGDDDRRLWKKCLFAATYAATPRTVLQAAADFRRRSGKSLPADMPWLPEPGSIDWSRPVPAVYPWVRKKKKPDGPASTDDAGSDGNGNPYAPRD